MTKRRPSDKQLGWLQAVLVVGSVGATLLGARVLAAEDGVQTAVLATPQTVIETAGAAAPAAPSRPVVITSSGQTLTLDQQTLAPVPRAIRPNIRIVTRSRSSR